MNSPAKTSLLTALALASLVQTGGAQNLFLLDFGFEGTPTFQDAAPNDPDNAWNNVGTSIGGSDTGVLFDLQTVDGEVVTGMNLEMIRRFNGANQNGFTLSGLYPENATRDSLFGNTEAFSGLSDVFPAFKLTGLDPSVAYTFTFYASRMGVGDNRSTAYSVEGANSGVAVLDAANNDLDRTAIVEAITPNDDREITISIGPADENNNGNHFTYLGVLRIETVQVVEEVTITGHPQDQATTEFIPVTFSVSASGSAPFSVQWFRNDVEIPGATGFSYRIDEPTLDLDGSVFTAAVSNATSSATSDGATLSVIEDIIPPVLRFAYSPDGTTVQAIFSEPLDADSAADPANYSVVDSGEAVSVTGVELDATRTIVALTVDVALTGEFQLTASNVRDRAGNAVEPNSTVTGQAPDPDSSRILIDFGGAVSAKGDFPNDPVNEWNSVPDAIGGDDFGLLPGLITTAGTVTEFDLQMVNRFNGTNTNGATNSQRYPASASGDSLYGNTEEWNSLIDVFPKFMLIGLNPAKAYTFLFYASRLGVTDNRETGFTVTGAAGAAFVAFDPANNDRDAFARLESVSPTPDGDITIALAPTENNNNGFHFTYLGVLEILEVEGVAPAPFVVTSVVLDETLGELAITWNSRPGRIYSIEELGDGAWFEYADSIPGQAGSTTFTVTDVDPAADANRIFRVVEQP